MAAFREAGAEAFSVLLAPERYLAGSRLADLFDARITYEKLRNLVDDKDRAILDAAILQAETSYEPVANTRPTIIRITVIRFSRDVHGFLS